MASVAGKPVSCCGESDQVIHAIRTEAREFPRQTAPANAISSRPSRQALDGLRRSFATGSLDTGLAKVSHNPVNLRGSLKELRSEEHTSELQSHLNLVCRLLLEKKKKKT